MSELVVLSLLCGLHCTIYGSPKGQSCLIFIAVLITGTNFLIRVEEEAGGEVGDWEVSA